MSMKEVINDLLGYEGLKIIQRPDIFNFSLDSTLLASFATINKADKMIVDLGCGNAPIPLFLSLRTKAKIYGIEIQPEIADLAKRSVELNKLENQITILEEDIKNAYLKLGVSCFDVVTCNPPYFIYKETSNINKNDYLTIARHEVKITLAEVLISANRLLKEGGRLAMVHRTDRLIDVLDAFRKYGIEPKRLRFVYPKQSSKESLIILLEGMKSKGKGNLKVLPPLYVYNENNTYTDEILEIFRYRGEVVKK
ncbi:MAG: tRNA1(Val) (adenine(37)-N6)-methyltransferase [Bacilli bacterium]|jgi:tRNA1Val (adenine37-N6)-methyltransferase|nr:MAG: N5-glutamine S-adenosyl-L-methionine-dependent methyltransferase [Tenericutes bacterium ADurb.Bin140]